MVSNISSQLSQGNSFLHLTIGVAGASLWCGVRAMRQYRRSGGFSPPLYLIADIGVLWNGFGVRSHKIVGLFQVSVTRLGLGRASAPRGAGDGVAVVIVVTVEHGAVVCGLDAVVVGEHCAVVGEHVAVVHGRVAVEGVEEY